MTPARKAAAAPLALGIALAFGAGILVMDLVRDRRDAERWAGVARERVFRAGQEACFPGPGQRAVQTWKSDRIDCVVYENWSRGLAPRAVLALSMLALAPPLGVAP